jgi:hypothetical protein
MAQAPKPKPENVTAGLTAETNVADWKIPDGFFPRFPLDEKLAALDVGTYERGNRPRDRLWASQLGGCPRAVWHSWQHPRPHDDEFENHRGALGHAVEDMVFERLLKRITIAREVSFTNHKVSGRVDGFIRFDREEHQVPVEVKSTYAFDWSITAPHKDHVAQALWYAQQDDSPFAILLYVDLSNYNNHSGHWGALRLPRADAWVDALTENLWAVVHANAEPVCREPGINPKTGKLKCFGCSLLETGTAVEP